MRSMLPLIALLIVVSGCARPDWIQRTLVTVDVTGTWERAAARTSQGAFQLSLEQQGSQVKGLIRNFGGSCANVAGPIEGTVAGDVFSFRHVAAALEGELTVSGDEMAGHGKYIQVLSMYLHRVDSPARPSSPQP